MASSSNHSDQSSSHGRHPAHLKGKAIGMFYAQRSKAKKKKNETEERLAVYMNSRTESSLTDLVMDLQRMRYPSTSSHHFDFKEAYWKRQENRGDTSHYSSALTQMPDLDNRLQEELQSRSVDQEIGHKTKKLPSYGMKEAILKLIEENQVVVITGETGCGKTTQVPQYILDSYIQANKGSMCHVVCTQPRRISAISVAERIAAERGVSCGYKSPVGYQIRLEGKTPRDRGSLLFCTTGILLQKLQSCPYLNHVSHVIVDEVHERDLQSDFLLINLRDIIKVRKDLKVILMSATMNSEEFSSYFGDCAMIEIPGFTYPVQDYSLEDMIEMTKYDSQAKNYPVKGRRRGNRQTLEDEHLAYLDSLHGKYSSETLSVLSEWDEKEIDLTLILVMLKHISKQKKEGAVLIFLPGWMQINGLNSLLINDTFFASSRFLIIPLHSRMPTVNQREVFNKPPSGVRKIIIATNIAETSITIDDVVFVIDSGKIKMKSFDVENNIRLLQPEWVAISNVKQRRGRAGRTQPGVCYHMFTKYRESELAMYQLPEMLRSSLEEIILTIKILKLGQVIPFLGKAMNPPNMSVIQESLRTLRRINALTIDENLTSLGFHLAKLPMDPHTGKMILFGAIFSCLDPILSVAASLSFKDAFMVPLGKEKEVDQVKKELAMNSQSDHLLFAYAIEQWEKAKSRSRGNDRNFCYDNFLSSTTLKMLKRLKEQYCQYLVDLGFIQYDDPKYRDYNLNSGNEQLLKAVICAGLYPNVARLTNAKPCAQRRNYLKAFTEDGNQTSVHPKSVNAFEENMRSIWLAYHLKMKSTNIFLHDTTPVTAYALLLFGGKLEMERSNGQETITIDDWIVLQCSRRKADLIMHLRSELDNLLEYKIQRPGSSDWNPSSKEGRLLNCIVELLTDEQTLTVADMEFLNIMHRR